MKLAGFALVLGLILASARPASAEVRRFAVVIGNNLGHADEVELGYAEDDATKIYDVLKDLGGFSADNMLLLRGDDAGAARQALLAINERIRDATGPGKPDTMLMVYYSGHADARALHMGRSSLALTELRQLVRGSAATFRLLVLDSCRSGAVTRLKGGRSAPPVKISLQHKLKGEGMVVLTASSANEDAQESDEVRGSFFTHYLVSGLLGAADADSDGRVVLEEVYRFAYQHTLRASSRSLAGMQHPTFSYQMRGQGEIVLTQVGRREDRATVTLPRGRDYLLFRGSAQGPVAAEVSAEDAVRRISLKAGRYYVRARADDYLLEGTVTLHGGAEQRIEDGGLKRYEYARLVRKGLGVKDVSHGPQLGFRARSPLYGYADDGCYGFFGAYAWESRVFNVVPRLGWCGGQVMLENGGVSGVTELSAELGVSHAWDYSWVTVDVGIAPGLSLLLEDGPDGGTGVGTAVILGSAMGLTRQLWGRYYVNLDVAAQIYLHEKPLVDQYGAPVGPLLLEGSGAGSTPVMRIGLGIGAHL